MSKETLFICKRHKYIKWTDKLYENAGFIVERHGATNYCGEPIRSIGNANLIIDKRRCVVCRGKRTL